MPDWSLRRRRRRSRETILARVVRPPASGAGRTAGILSLRRAGQLEASKMTGEIVGQVAAGIATVIAAIGGSKAWDKLRSNGVSGKLDAVLKSQSSIEGKVDGIDRRVSNIEGYIEDRRDAIRETKK